MSKTTEEILTACAIIVAVLAVAWSVATILERTYYSGYDDGWRECIEENSLYERYYYGE